jgi:hypothetical protein
MDELPITFRCPPELASVLPRPTPAVLGLPDWFKAMPQTAFSALLDEEQMTVKKCPPFIDAMTYGFLMPLAADVHVADGTLTWDRDVPAGALTAFQHAPIDFHDNNQVPRSSTRTASSSSSPTSGPSSCRPAIRY